MATSAESRSRLHWFIGSSDVRSADPGSLTYEPYFGLREKPFSLSSDPRFFFSQSSHGTTFDTLAAGIRRREGLLVLTGEVGTGKTTLCQAVLQSLDQKTFAALVPDPFVSREDLLKTLLVDFGVVSVDDIRSGRLRGASRTDLSYPLYEFLTSLQPLKAFAVVMIDEAQNLNAELLEEIRILSDLENGQKLLEVVLIGQPELRSLLATTALRQLSQRVSIRCELGPLAPADIARYVSHRLTVAGNDGRVHFTDAAIEFVSAASNGNPRVINLVCDRALLCAARSRTMIVKAEHVVWAVEDLKLPGAVAFDQARAFESFPEEFPKPVPQREAQSLAPQRQAAVLKSDAPVAIAEASEDPFKSFLNELHRVPTELEAAAPHQSENFWPAVDAPIPMPDVPRRAAEPAGTSQVLAADFSQTAPGIPFDDTRTREFSSAGWRRSAGATRLMAVLQRRRKWLAPAAVSLVLLLALADYRYSTPASPQPAAPLTQAMPSSEVGRPAPAAEGSLNPSAVPAGSSLPPLVGERAEAGSPVPANPLDGFAVQMATFQTSGRAALAVRDFQDAGYLAYSAERVRGDGVHVHSVFLGPYSERAVAERDRERAAQVPGYGTGLIVPIAPAEPAQKTP